MCTEEKIIFYVQIKKVFDVAVQYEWKASARRRNRAAGRNILV